jgi:hypothetical protein
LAGIKRTPADIAISNAVRIAVSYICQRCGIDYSHNTGQLDCSHVFSRKHRCIRWDTRNTLVLCRSCHSKMADAPLEHAELYKKIKGEAMYWELIKAKNTPIKIPKMEEKDIAKHYREETIKANSFRLRGYVGDIEIVNWMEKR